MRNYRDSGLTAEGAFNQVNGLLAVESYDNEQEKNVNMTDALAMCYSYLVQKRIEWTNYLEKLMELFLDLAFETEKHASIKEVLKHYRSITQSQYPDSLKHILEYYRDTKLQSILDDNISTDLDMDFVRNMNNIEEDQASSEIILSSFNPEVKNKREDIREKLKIVWDGYKTIIDTVRVNQRLESVYRATLRRIFDFVARYNRKQEFKSFCEYLRSGLRMALNRRDRTEHQRAFYIDIEREEVNTNNIEIRLEQFEVTTQLGLWQEAFQVLEDINEIMKVRKGSVKNSIKCSYFDKLALLFKKSSYWHYHAYAFYNYYSIYITKSKLTAEEKRKLSDKLILSVLCIPPSTLESHQSKESQEKIGAMMISSVRIPEKQQLQEMMVSKGIVESASKEIKELWYFMFLDFDLASLGKGLELLQLLTRDKEYADYIALLQDILIYKQLISISGVYQRMKYDNLIKLIPLPKSKIEKVLLESHQRKVIDFVLDEKQGIISFQEKSDETNPYEEFLSTYIDVALLHEETREVDRKHILNKVTEFTHNAEDYYWKVREYKIEEYKKKLKKPKQELQLKEREKEKKEKQEREREENERRVREIEAKQKEEKRQEELIKKKVIVEDIKKVKENRVVRIMNKKIENLTDAEIEDLTIEVLEKYLEETNNKVANDNEKKNKKKFSQVDYLERERRTLLKEIIQESVAEQQAREQENFAKFRDISRNDFEENQKLKKSILSVAPEVKQKIQHYYDQGYANFLEDTKKFKNGLEDEFKAKIINKARELYNADKKMKEELEQRRKEANEEAGEVSWSFKKPAAADDGAKEEGGKWGRKDVTRTEEKTTDFARKPAAAASSSAWGRKTATSSNPFEQLETHDQPKQQSGGKWGIGTKKDQAPVEEQKKPKQDAWGKKKVVDVNSPKIDVNANPTDKPQVARFVPPPVEKPKGAWDSTKTEEKKDEPKFKAWGDAPTKTEQKKEETKPKGKGKGW